MEKGFMGVSPTNVTKAGLIIAIAMSVIAPLFTSIMYGLVWPDTFFEWVWAWPALIFLVVVGVLNLVVRALSRLLLKRGVALTVADAAFIYVAIACSAGFAYPFSLLIGQYTHMVYKDPTISDYGRLMPSMWVPNQNVTVGDQSFHILAPIHDSTARDLLLSDKNWLLLVLGHWAPSLAFWILVFAFLAVSQIGLAILFRKPWIDEEMLPFPYAQIAIEAMRVTGFKGVWEHRGFSKKMFLVGVIIGVAILLPNLLSARKIIEAPPIYGQLLVSQHGGYDLSPTIGRNVALMVTLAPLFIGLAFLLPIDVLITAVIWYLIMYIVLPPIETTLGIVPLTPTQDAHTNYFTIGHWYGLMPHMITRGVAIGFPLAWLFFIRRHLANIRRDREVMIGTVLAVVGFAASSALLIASGVEAHIGLMVIVVTLLLYTTWMRIRAETTWTTALYTYGPWWHEMLVLPWIPYRFAGNWGSKEAFAASASFYPLVTDRTLATTPGPAVMEGFRLSKITGINWRKIALIALVSSIVGIAVSSITTLWGMYRFSLRGVPGGEWTGAPDRGLEPGWIDSMVHMNKIEHMSNDHLLWLPQFIVGIALGAVLIWLKTIVPGVPFNPIGILIGDMPITGVLMFIPNVVALIVKTITIKVIGVEGYEKNVVPLMAGLVLSSFVMMWFTYVSGRILG